MAIQYFLSWRAQFTKLGSSLMALVGYGIAFYFLSLSLKSIPVGIAYAVWVGLGVALVTLIAWGLYGQKLDVWGLVGIGLIVSGVAVLNLLSGARAHGTTQRLTRISPIKIIALCYYFNWAAIWQARNSHQWYLDTFGDAYPKARKAVFPGFIKEALNLRKSALVAAACR